ncbi:hypothetical protein [Glutamicibacter halophytocola]|uniref:Uncharacterized protein n=1 Tax=Glutamicibacter halophytocola TaxID=1933880 RepID=A0AA95BTA0_9MICC|nr:hypothetical protein [Glutamicibacter halophytocola]UUX60162.1 hypothetical protein NUH22_06000 [Glutamicibacter halophytocola]
MLAEPPGLGERGSTLFRSLTDGEDNPLVIEVAIEAARAADRLDDLDRAIQGQGVLDLMRATIEDMEKFPEKIEIKLDFRGVLMEGRQQQDNFRKLLAEVQRLKSAASKGKPEAQPQSNQPGLDAQSSVDDELAARRKAREASRQSG